MRFKR